MPSNCYFRSVTAVALAAALLLLPGCQMGGSGGGSSSSAPPQVEIEKEYARFPRFQDRNVTEENRILPLTNWKKSPFNLVYTLSVDGKAIYESPVLEPGEKLDWDILAYCKTSCDLEITATAYTQDGEEANSVVQLIHLKLPKKKTTAKKTAETDAKQKQNKKTKPAEETNAQSAAAGAQSKENPQ